MIFQHLSLQLNLDASYTLDKNAIDCGEALAAHLLICQREKKKDTVRGQATAFKTQLIDNCIMYNSNINELRCICLYVRTDNSSSWNIYPD